MGSVDTERNPNLAIVEAARQALREAARNLTAEFEPAAIYSLAPHAMPEEISDEGQP